MCRQRVAAIQSWGINVQPETELGGYGITGNCNGLIKPLIGKADPSHAEPLGTGVRNRGVLKNALANAGKRPICGAQLETSIRDQLRLCQAV